MESNNVPMVPMNVVVLATIAQFIRSRSTLVNVVSAASEWTTFAILILVARIRLVETNCSVLLETRSISNYSSSSFPLYHLNICNY